MKEMKPFKEYRKVDSKRFKTRGQTKKKERREAKRTW